MQLATRDVLSEVPLLRFQTKVMQKLKKLIESVELPPNIFPAFQIHPAQSSSGLFKNRKNVMQAHWEDCPALIRFRGLSQPVVLAGIPVTPVEKPGEVCNCVIVKREVAPEFLQLIQKITARTRESRWCVYGALSGRVKSGQRWSGQNRPTDVARDMVLLSHLLLIRQVRFRSPAPWSAFQDVTVV